MINNTRIDSFQVNIEQDPDIIDPGTFGADFDNSFLRFEFNDYPSEVFYPNNDFYNNNDDIAENIYAEVEVPDMEGQFNKTVPEGWIRKSFEQLTLQQNLETKNKMAPRSKSLDSDLRSNYDDSDNEEYVATRESDCDFKCENAPQCDFKCENVPHCELPNCDLSKSDVVCCDGCEEQTVEKKKFRSKRNDVTADISKR